MRWLMLPHNKANYTLNNPLFYLNRHFRDIALATPSAWTTASANSSEDVRIILERSGSCLLDFAGPARLWPNVFPELSRCKSIRLGCDDAVESNNFIWELPAHKLQSFSLRIAANEYSNKELCQALPLFQGDAPKLRALHIGWIPIVTDPVWTQLVELELCYVGNIDRDVFQLCLNTCRSLHTLKTQCCNSLRHPP